MDGVTSTKQVTARSSEKATAQQHLKEVEREKAALEIQVVALGKESEGKAKDIAKITNELRAAEQGIEKLKGQKHTYELTLEDKGSGLAALKDQMQKVQDEKAKYLQAMDELEHSTAKKRIVRVDQKGRARAEGIRQELARKQMKF